MSLIPPPTPPIIAAAGALVGEVLAESQTLAQESASRGLTAIQSLADFSVTIPEIVAPAFTVPSITPSAAGAVPTDPGNIVETMPVAPTEPVQGALPALDVGEAPEYTLVAPLLVDVPLPDPLSAVLPLAPVLPEIATPTEPDFTLPDVPTFASLNIPDAPTFDVPLFTDEVPDAPTAPDPQFVWAEVEYRSDMLANLNNRLLTFIQGRPSAIPAEVEDAIWMKALDAESVVTYTNIDDAMNAVAARGFSIPGGQALRAAQMAVSDGLKRDTEANRQLMVEQWKLEQANFHFAFTSAMNLEGRLIALFNSVQQRALDAAKFRVEALIQMYNARVQLYLADVTAFGAKAEVFKTRLQAALATLDIYKAQLQAVQIKGQLNVQLAEQYTAQIDGVKALAEVFKARVQAVTLAVDTNKNRTETYRAEVEAYAEISKANVSQVKGYLAQIEGEQAKVDMFAAEVSGYSARTDAYRVLTSAKLSEATIQFRQLQEFPVELYRGRIAGYQATIQNETARLQATADIFTARVEAYAASEKVSSKDALAQAEVAATTTKIYASQAQLSINAATINARLEQTRAETAQASLRAAGQLSTQLAAAALSARNVTASITGSTSSQSGMTVNNSSGVSATNSNSETSHTTSSKTSANNKSFGGGVLITHSYETSDSQRSADTVNNAVQNSHDRRSSSSSNKSVRNSFSTSVRANTSVSDQTIYTHKG